VRPVANLYREPNLNSDVVSQAFYGSNVKLVKSKRSWFNVRTPDGYTGWMQRSSAKKLSGRLYAADGAAVRVAQLSANLYREPDVTKHAPVTTIPWESRLEVLPGKVDNGTRWLKVRQPDDSVAYIQAGDVSADFAPLTVEQMISVARRFIGITYTWGGSSAFGFDCSGFTQMLERQRGIVMPRDADQQAAWSGVTAVARAELLPGDLLFFGESLDRVTHTGMYIGNGEFIHDTTHDHPGVQISKLADDPWTRLLVAARRVKP
jgi:gamma-D-glutamyl-L-lysine dipeptidyl-peptidase